MRARHSDISAAEMFFKSVHVPSWMRDALCHREGEEPDDWFPPSGQAGPPARHALEVCGACPVNVQCLTYALTYDGSPRPLAGIWGGTSEHQRRSARERLRDNRRSR